MKTTSDHLDLSIQVVVSKKIKTLIIAMFEPLPAIEHSVLKNHIFFLAAIDLFIQRVIPQPAMFWFKI